ncbi:MULTISPECIES: hypothetical protein [unclassified Streptomyces]|uniref:hypothetical protein n=1 Tax=unclassified Streptomyces TaxID=2593676 RepID=UPI000DB94D08|nr:MULTISPECIES: hypothetical protein [unclassified Streptomyces]MYT73157.1 hypothetical protein [Streptomyces sp. SID8367]RAJ73618.1 hypothetical protein K377_07047 [Streptomyces sp. PsTaAH-137]
MPGTLPVPLTCEIPEGWEAAPPEEVGAPQAAFVALHSASRGSGFMPNITVTGTVREDGASLHRVADESVQRLQETVGPVTLVKRTDVGTHFKPSLIDAPGVVQNLRIAANVNGQPEQLAQSQLILLLEDPDQPRRLAEIEIALTARFDQLQDVLDDFQEFLRTVRPAGRSDVGKGGG